MNYTEIFIFIFNCIQPLSYSDRNALDPLGPGNKTMYLILSWNSDFFSDEKKTLYKCYKHYLVVCLYLQCNGKQRYQGKICRLLVLTSYQFLWNAELFFFNFLWSDNSSNFAWLWITLELISPMSDTWFLTNTGVIELKETQCIVAIEISAMSYTLYLTYILTAYLDN